MKMAALTFMTFFSVVPGFAQEVLLSDFLDSRRPQGFGEAVIQLRENGIVHGEVLSEVIVYEYRIGEARDRSHSQYLAAFDITADGLVVIAEPVLVGISGTQRITDLAVEDGVILLSGLAWNTGDPVCCPDRAITVEYAYADRALVALGQ